MENRQLPKTYRIAHGDGWLLSVKNGFLWKAREPKEVLVFIEISEEWGILLPESNLANLSGTSRVYNLFAYNGEANRASAYLLRKIDKNDKAVFQEPRTRLFYSIRNSRSLPGYQLYSETIANTEQFSLIPAGYCDNACKGQIDLLDHAQKSGVGSLHLEDISRVATDILIQVLDKRMLENLFAPYFNPKGIKFLKENFQADFLIDKGFAQKPLDPICELGPDLSPVKWYYLSTRYREAGQVINQIYRKSIKPAHKCCIVTSIRNEGIYLLEFIAYYRALGVDSIFIYSNDNDDGSDGLLDSLARHGFVYHLKNNIGGGFPRQSSALAHAVTLNYEVPRHRFALFIDPDEFLVINRDKFSNLDDFLDFHKQCDSDSISFNWVFVGMGGNLLWRNEPLLKRFPRGANTANPHVKSMFNPRLAGSIQCHFPLPIHGHSLNVVTPGGEPVSNTGLSWTPLMDRAFSANKSLNEAVLLHYWAKSADEFIVKAARNPGGRTFSEGINFSGLTPQKLKMFVDLATPTHAMRSYVSQDQAAQTYEYMEYLLSFGDVKSAQDAVVANFEERLKKCHAAFKAHMNENPDIWQTLRPVLSKHSEYAAFSPAKTIAKTLNPARD